MGYHDGRAVFVPGPLPGETALVELLREKRTWAEGLVQKFTNISDERTHSHEDHYLHCSPWQNVNYSYQIELKKSMLADIFARPELGLDVAGVVAAPQLLGYRNKLEFSLVANEFGHLDLGLHQRRSDQIVVPTPQGCVLGDETMNRAAKLVVEQLNDLNVGDAATSLTVRRSLAHGRLLVLVTLSTPLKRQWTPLLVSGVDGVMVVQHILHQAPEVLWSAGETDLRERFSGLELTYPWDAFFQVNPAAFETALGYVVAAVKPGSNVIDLYGGVGAIGLAVARTAKHVVGVEVMAASAELAELNAVTNRIHNYQSRAQAAEGLLASDLAGVDTVIVDPPRAGLHSRVRQVLNEALPERIIYLSCNPVTQARDIMDLSEHYQAGKVQGFDFYPGTLHVESLVILDRK